MIRLQVVDHDPLEGVRRVLFEGHLVTLNEKLVDDDGRPPVQRMGSDDIPYWGPEPDVGTIEDGFIYAVPVAVEFADGQLKLTPGEWHDEEGRLVRYGFDSPRIDRRELLIMWLPSGERIFAVKGAPVPEGALILTREQAETVQDAMDRFMQEWALESNPSGIVVDAEGVHRHKDGTVASLNQVNRIRQAAERNMKRNSGVRSGIVRAVLAGTEPPTYQRSPKCPS